MKFQHIILISSLYFLTENIRSSYSKIRQRRHVSIKKKECLITRFGFEECDKEVSRFGNYRFRLKYETSCNIKNPSFVYSFGKDGEDPTTTDSFKSVMTMKQILKTLEGKNRILIVGTNIIEATMKAKTFKDVELSASSDKCKFYVRNENATADLGGWNRNVQSGRSFIVDASQSVNNDLVKRKLDLEYKWNCTSSNSFCEKNPNLGTGPTVEVPAEYAVQGDSFNFTVYVRSIPTDWQSDVQFIKVDDKHPYVVNCIYGCKSPNTFSPTSDEQIVVAQCQFSCEQYENETVQSALKVGVSISTHKGVKFDRPGFRDPWRIDVDELELFTEHFSLGVYINNAFRTPTLGTNHFVLLPKPKLTNCKTIPPKGKPLSKFKLHCDYDEKTKKQFEVRVKSGATVIYSETSPKLEDIEFLISSQSATVDIKLESIHDVFTVVEIPVQIEPLLREDENVTSAIEHLTDIYEGKNETEIGVKEMIENGEHKKAVQMIDMIAGQIANVKVQNEEDEKRVLKIKKNLIDDVSKIPITDVDISKSVSGVMKFIAGDRKNKTDSEMAKLLSDVCSKTAKEHRYLVENDLEDTISQEDNQGITYNLMSCSESEMSPYYEMFNETAIDLEITTKFPINENLSEKNFEDYPQYVADDLVEQKVAEFLSAAESMIELCRDMTGAFMRQIDSTMYYPQSIRRESSILSWFKSTGQKVAEATFDQHDVEVHSSMFLKQYSELSMHVCSYSKDPYWSASEQHKIPTNVIDVGVLDESKGLAIRDFHDEPMNITFKVFKHLVKAKITNIKVTTINDYSEFKEDEFTIVMINAKREESFFIDFKDIGKNDHFEFIVIDMERPQLKHFVEPWHVNHFSRRFFIEHHEKSDKWFMLGIRPHKTLAVQEESILSFSVYSPICVSWQSNMNNWKFACSVFKKSTVDMIYCKCFHLSTLAGSFEYNELKEHPKFLKLEFELEEARSLFIPLVTCLLLLVYFFLLLYFIQKNETIEDAVFLMPDVPADNRFAYLVVVKTGARINSGTSSDIVIRLIGTKYQSQEHVINFPDPLEELLQNRQEDYFVLATPVHLGKLEKIHLWFDCTGMSPTWYCQNVRVCDLQTKQWHFFDISKWFKVEGKSKIFVSATISSKKQEDKHNSKRLRLLRSLLNFGRFKKTMWRMSTISENTSFGYSKRLTLILSVILSILCYSIELYGRPEYIPRDSITVKCYFDMNAEVLWKGICSALITFLPHLAIMEGFKNSRLQYQSKRSRDAKALPEFCTIVCWCTLILNITLVLHYLLIYGYRVVQPKTMDCMTSSVLGFVFYVFILDYIYNFSRVLLGGPVKSVKYNYEKILKNVEEQRRVLYKFLGRYIYRPILTPIYKIITPEDCVRKKFYFRQQREMIWQVQDFFMVITFVFLLYIIVLGEKDWIYDYRGHRQALQLTEGIERTRYKLENVTHLKDFEDYMEKYLIPSIQSYQWYGTYVSDSPGMTSDAANKYMGVIRLRQHRVEDDTCIVLDEMKFLNVTCKVPNYFVHFDSYNYTPAWNATIPEVHKSRLGSVWGHQVGVGKILIGLTGYYESGGYVAELGRTMENSYVNFNYLKRYNWIDSLTRAIIVEFSLYNVNMKLFHFVEIVFEKSATGYLNKEVTVQTERVLKHSSRSQITAMICCTFFMILIILLAARTLKRILDTKVWYKRDLWHVVDLIIISLSFLWVGIYFKRESVLQEFARQLDEHRSNDFVNYFPILKLTNWMKIPEGLLVCLSTVRMWRILRFGVTFRTVERTFMFSANSILLIGFCFILFLIGFGVPTYMILGSQVEKFRNPYFVFKTLILNSIGLNNMLPEEAAQNERGLGYVLYVLYSWYSTFLTTLFIAIIMVDYMRAREFAFNEVLEYNLKDYTVDSFRSFKRRASLLARKFRLTAGKEPKIKHPLVSPKYDELRYKNCVKTDSNRMKAMGCVAKCVLLKLQKGLRVDEADQALMMRTVKNLCNKEGGKKEIFFVQETRDEEYAVIDDRRILMIERVVKLMLETPEERSKKMEGIKEEESLRASNWSRITRMNGQLELMCQVVKNIEVSIISNKDNV